MTLLITYVAVALGFSFLCSVLEAVLLSVTPSYVARLEEEKPRLGQRLAALKRDVDRPLAAILSLNTIANTFGAAGAGAEATRVFGSEWFGVASAILTFSILVCSEIIPKTLGAIYWRRLAPLAATVLPALMFLLSPLVIMSEVITRLLKRNHKRTGVSKEEIAALARLGQQQGILDESESRILANLFRFSNLKAKDVMTPRTVLFSIPSTTKVRKLVPSGSLRESGIDDTAQKSTMVFSRIPVYGESPDDVLGYVLKDEIFLRAARDELELPVSRIMRKIQSVPDTLPLPKLFEALVESREHIALVTNEYGGIAGIVTMEDVIETLLGLEIVDEADDAVDMREMARAKWQERRVAMGTIPPPALEDPAWDGDAQRDSGESELESDAEQDAS